MNLRRVVFVATVLVGAATVISLSGCGGSDDNGQPDEAVTQAALDVSSNKTGTDSQDGLWYTFWKNGGSATMTMNGGKHYSTIFNMSSSDFVCGKGWSTGSNTAVTYSGSYSHTGGGCFGVYGWTDNPRVEYYVCDAVGNNGEGPHNSSHENPKPVYKGAVTTDGDAYTIYKHTRVGQPCPWSDSCTFDQYISIRNNRRTQGTITLQNHIDAWAGLGMNLGSWNTTEKTYKVLVTEGWDGNGTSEGTLAQGLAQVTGAAVKTWGYGLLDFSWNAVSGATSYVVTRATYDSDNHVSDVVSNTVTGTTFSDMVPDWFLKYQYSVAASNGSIMGPSPKAVTVLPAPSATLTTAGTKLTITWSKVTGATSYVVQDGGGNTPYSGTGTSWSTTLSSGSWYVYMVKAFDGTTLGTAWLTMGFMP